MQDQAIIFITCYSYDSGRYFEVQYLRTAKQVGMLLSSNVSLEIIQDCNILWLLSRSYMPILEKHIHSGHPLGKFNKRANEDT